MRPRLAAALVTLALIAPALRAPAAGAVAPCAGVRVVVDFGHWNGAVEEHCVTNPASGLDALHQAGFATEPTRQFGDAYVCRIDGLPSRDDEACVVTPPANAYWAYYWARPGDASWHYSDTAATGRKPPAGSIDAWAFGDNALPRISPAAFPRVAPPATQPPTTQPRIVGPQGTAPPQPASIHPSPKVSNAAVPKTATTGAHTTVTTTPASTIAGRHDERRTVGPTTTTTAVRVIDRATAPAAAHESSGSPWPVFVAFVLLAALGAGAFLVIRARRRPVS